MPFDVAEHFESEPRIQSQRPDRNTDQDAPTSLSPKVRRQKEKDPP